MKKLIFSRRDVLQGFERLGGVERVRLLVALVCSPGEAPSRRN